MFFTRVRQRVFYSDIPSPRRFLRLVKVQFNDRARPVETLIVDQTSKSSISSIIYPVYFLGTEGGRGGDKSQAKASQTNSRHLIACILSLSLSKYDFFDRNYLRSRIIKWNATPTVWSFSLSADNSNGAAKLPSRISFIQRSSLHRQANLHIYSNVADRRWLKARCDQRTSILWSLVLLRFLNDLAENAS